jgi:hypothetical protein
MAKNFFPSPTRDNSAGPIKPAKGAGKPIKGIMIKTPRPKPLKVPKPPQMKVPQMKPPKMIHDHKMVMNKTGGMKGSLF